MFIPSELLYFVLGEGVWLLVLGSLVSCGFVLIGTTYTIVRAREFPRLERALYALVCLPLGAFCLLCADWWVGLRLG